jgi:hypothetical protein
MKASRAILLLLSLMICTGFVQAQMTHYPAGVEGIKGSTLPPPGLYIRDYNYTYWSNEYKNVGPSSFDVVANVQAPRLVFISNKLFWGGYYGADIIVPLVYQNVTADSFSKSRFGVGDIFIEPATVSWHLKKADIAIGWGIWAPTAESDYSDPSKPGKGFTTHMFTGGVTYYPDKKRSWSISALNRYEVNYERNQDYTRPGQVYTLEWGVAKNAAKTVDLGLAGYIQTQTFRSAGTQSTILRERGLAIGPEITFNLSKIGLSSSIRYLKEVSAQQRPQGSVLNVTFTRLIKGYSKKRR